MEHVTSDDYNAAYKQPQGRSERQMAEPTATISAFVPEKRGHSSNLSTDSRAESLKASD